MSAMTLDEMLALLPENLREADFNSQQWLLCAQSSGSGYECAPDATDKTVLVVRRTTDESLTEPHLLVRKTPAGFGIVVRLASKGGSRAIAQHEARAMLRDGRL